MSVATAFPAFPDADLDAGLEADLEARVDPAIDADAGAGRPGTGTVLVPRVLRLVPSEPPLDQPWEPAGTLALPLPVRPALLPPHVPATPVETETTRARPHGATRPAPRPTEVELGRLFGPEATPRSELPDPRPKAAAAVRILLEVLCGDRPTRQVAKLVSPAILEQLEHRHPSRFRAEPRRYELRSLHLSEPADCVAEVAAVVFTPATHRGQTRERCRAVAMRLEGADGRWTVTAFTTG
jgi:hypothetical protein